MDAPTDMETYRKRFEASYKMDGYGLDVSVTMPCPFCAAPDWMHYRVLDVREAMEQGATCKECGRSARALFNDSPNVMQFTFVQTGGDDQPDWLTPKMGRVDEH